MQSPDVSSQGHATDNIECCLLTRDAEVIALASAAATKAGATCIVGFGCANCKVPCKPIVAVDLADGGYLQSARTARSRGGAKVLIAIANNTNATKEAQDNGFRFIVYRSLIERFLPSVLRIASSLISS
jgi:hypothetical protein